MDRPRDARPSAYHDSSMYDDEPDRPYRNGENGSASSEQGYSGLRKDLSRTPPRGPAADSRSDEYQRPRRDYGHRQDRSFSPRREGRRRYNDRDREGYRSPRYDRSRSRSRSRSPYYGGAPSRTVILEGLPLEMTQEDGLAFVAVHSKQQIFHELQHIFQARHLEDVRLIRDKKTGVSRGFAFAQFPSVEDAKDFLRQNYPAIFLGVTRGDQPGDEEPQRVRIAFSRDKDDRDRPGAGEDDWKCELCFLANYPHRVLCFRCNAPKPRPQPTAIITPANVSSYSGLAMTGDSDVSPDNIASQFLLLRGLEPGVSEELLAKGVKKLYKTPETPQQGAPQPAKKIKSSTATEVSSGAKEGSLRRVLLVRDRKSNDSWRYGFAEFNTVEDAQAAMNKFNAMEKFTISSKPVLVSYIHAGVFVPVLQQLPPGSENFTFSPLNNPSLKLKYWDEAAYASEHTVAVIQPSLAQMKERVQAKLAAAAAKEGLVNSSKESESKSKKRKAEKDSLSSNKKAVAPHLQFWTNRHAEIHGIQPKDASENDAAANEASTQKESSVDPPSQSYVDQARNCCLLCSRQFKSAAEANKHERLSELHRTNLQNESLKAKALAKLGKSASADSEADSAYRDRARERRQAYNQPKQPAAQHKKPKENDLSPPAQERQEDVPAPKQSKGAALLGKMGWTAGQGLGAEGTGRTEAIATEIYAQGVGLGAQGGKIGDAMTEADRQTKGTYKDFVNMAKDKAKERFHQMN